MENIDGNHKYGKVKNETASDNSQFLRNEKIINFHVTHCTYASHASSKYL